MNNLAYIYNYGSGEIAKDIKKAVSLYEKSVDLGNTKAMNNLARIYYYGAEGFPQDLQKSIYLYQLSAQKGNQFAKDILKKLEEETGQCVLN